MTSVLSTEAIAVARENAANLDLNHRCTFMRTDWAAWCQPGSC